MPNASPDPGQAGTGPSKPPLSLAAKAATALCALYAAGLLVLWAFMAMAPAGNWIVTLIIYGPRWVFATPLALLVPLTAFRPRLLGLVGLSLLVLLGPVMGGCLPWRAWLPRASAPGDRLKVMSFNMQGGESDLFAVGQLVAAEAPDLIVCVESNPDLQSAALWRGRWYVEKLAGITVASRRPISRAETLRHPSVRPGAILGCEVDVDGRRILVFGLHLTTPRGGLEAATHLSRDTPNAIRNSVGVQILESHEVGSWIAARRIGRPTLVLGDFNMPEESAIYRAEFGDLSNSFSQAGLGFGPTKFTRWFGARIDHILHSGHWRSERSWVGPDLGSDHRPVFAELRWIEGPSPDASSRSKPADNGARRTPLN